MVAAEGGREERVYAVAMWYRGLTIAVLNGDVFSPTDLDAGVQAWTHLQEHLKELVHFNSSVHLEVHIDACIVGTLWDCPLQGEWCKVSQKC